MGMSAEEINGSRLDILSETARGDISTLTPEVAAGMDREARAIWGRNQLIEWIDREITRLEEHAETIDLDTIDQDRAEAADRALFDPSKEASLARRYESEARQGFFRALGEFRQAEAEVEAAESDAGTPEPVETSEPLASFREIHPVSRIPAVDSGLRKDGETVRASRDRRITVS
jgi:hypothetical protein